MLPCSSGDLAGGGKHQLVSDDYLAGVAGLQQPEPRASGAVPDSQVALISYSDLHLGHEIGQGSYGKVGCLLRYAVCWLAGQCATGQHATTMHYLPPIIHCWA